MQAYTYTNEDLEEEADILKGAVVQALVVEGLLEYKVADAWCAEHAPKIKRRSVFRTLSDWWRKSNNQRHWVMVKDVGGCMAAVQTEDPDCKRDASPLQEEPDDSNGT